MSTQVIDGFHLIQCLSDVKSGGHKNEELQRREIIFLSAYQPLRKKPKKTNKHVNYKHVNHLIDLLHCWEW